MRPTLKKLAWAALFCGPLLAATPAVRAGSEPLIEFRVQLGHASHITALAVSPDGKLAASVSHDNTVKIWDIATGRDIRTLQGFGKALGGAAFSPDGQGLLTAESGLVRLWNVGSGAQVRTFPQPDNPGHVAFARDGQAFLLPGGEATEVRALADGALIRSLPAAGLLDLSRDGSQVLLVSGSKIRLVRLQDGQILREFEAESSPNAIRFAPDGRSFATGSSDKTLSLWDTSQPQEILNLQGHRRSVTDVDFSPDGRTVLSASQDKTLKLWDRATGQELQTFTGHDGPVSAVRFMPGGRGVLSASADKTLKLWDLASQKVTRTFQGYTDPVVAVAFSPDGRYAASAGADRTVKVWEPATGRNLWILPGHSGYVLDLDFSPDGKRLLSGSEDGTVLVWDLERRKILQQLKGHTQAVQAVAFSPNGKLIASGGSDRDLRVWDAASGQVLKRMQGHSGALLSLAFAADGQRILSAEDTAILVWDLATSKVLKQIKTFSYSTRSVQFSPDGHWAVAGGTNGSEANILIDGKPIQAFVPGAVKASLWDLQAGKETAVFDTGLTYPNQVAAVAYAPNGKWVLVAGADNNFSLWSIKNQQKIHTFPGHTDKIHSLAISPDSRRILSGSNDRTLKLWDAPSGKHIYSSTANAQGDYLTWTPDGYFDGTPAAHQNFVFLLKGLEVYAIDQFFESLFKPPVIQARASGQDTSAFKGIAGFRQPPLIEIVVPVADKDRPLAQQLEPDGAMAVVVRATAREGGLGAIRLYHNGKLVQEETRGVELEEGQGEQLRRFRLKPVDGENVLSAVAYSADQYRTESRPAQVTLAYAAPKAAPVTLHLLAVGINQYQNPSYNLNYAIPDAEGFAEVLKLKGGNLFDRIESVLLKDAEATRANIQKALEDLKRKSQPEDVVVIYYAGHGLAVDDEFYFVSHDVTQMANARQLKSLSLSSADLRNALKDIQARKQLVILDACQAGAAVMQLASWGDLSQKQALGYLSRLSGIVVLSATTKQQQAAELTELGHGIFTFSLIEGLKGNASAGKKVTVLNLAAYLDEQVPELTQKYRGELQQPQKFIYGTDFPLAVK